MRSVSVAQARDAARAAMTLALDCASTDQNKANAAFEVACDYSAKAGGLYSPETLRVLKQAIRALAPAPEIVLSR